MSDTHPFHQAYMLTDPLNAPVSTLEQFFEVLDAVDSSTVEFLAGMTGAAIGTHPRGSKAADLMASFKSRCLAMRGGGILDFFIIHSTVCYTLVGLRIWGDDDHAKDNIRWLQGGIRFFEARDAEVAEGAKKMAEKAMHDIADRTIAMRKQYEHFCEDIVSKLLPKQLLDHLSDLV